MRKARNNYPNRLFIARKRSGLRQKSVARRLGIKRDTQISFYETGRVAPSLETALKLSVIYGVTVNELYKPLIGRIEQEVGTVEKTNLRTPTPVSRAFYL